MFIFGILIVCLKSEKNINFEELDENVHINKAEVENQPFDLESEKQLSKKEKDQIFLMPENPKYEPIEISGDKILNIWGVVTNIVKRVHKKK